MKNDDYKIKHKSLKERSFTLRGSIIDKAVGIESKIDTLLATYFCADERRSIEFAFALLSRENITFNTKFEVLQFVLINNFPNFIKKYPKLKKDIPHIIRIRNIVAHQKYFPTDEMVNNHETVDITFENWKTKDNKAIVKPFPLTQEELTKYEKAITDTETALFELRSKMGFEKVIVEVKRKG